MTLGPVRPSPLVEQATEQLRVHLVEGHWPIGSKLPGETTLAKTLGVGRSTVREALRSLAGAGLVQARQGAGVFVLATEPQEDWPTRLRRAELTDLYEVRMLIEIQAARLAAVRRTEDDVAALDAALAARRAAGVAGSAGAGVGVGTGAGAGAGAAGGDGAFVDADIALHTAVVAAAHNPVLTDLQGEFVPVLRDGLVDLIDLLGLREQDPAHGDARHAALVEAVRCGDPDAAADASREELEETLAQLRAV